MLSAGIAKLGLAEMQFQVTVRQVNEAASESFATAQAVKFVQPSLTNCHKTSELVFIVSSLWGKTLKESSQGRLNSLDQTSTWKFTVLSGDLISGMKEFASTVRSDKIYTQTIFIIVLLLLLHKILHMAEGAKKKIYIQHSDVS